MGMGRYDHGLASNECAIPKPTDKVSAIIGFIPSSMQLNFRWARTETKSITTSSNNGDHRFHVTMAASCTAPSRSAMASVITHSDCQESSDRKKQQPISCEKTIHANLDLEMKHP